MNDDLKWAYLDRYFSGLASPDESAALGQWAERDGARARALAELRRLWAAGGSAMATDEYDVDDAWAQVHGRMRRGRARVLSLRGPVGARSAATPSWRRPVAAAIGIAATLVLVIGGLVAARQLTLRFRTDAGDAPAPMRTYVTARGQRAELRLSDGTRIAMNVGSRVRMPADFGVERRDVILDGEAYFDVVHDPRRPFVVHTRRAVAEDLGTRFVVRAYGGDSSSVVTVVEGRVAVRSDSEGAPRPVAVQGGQVARVDAAGLITIASDADTSGALAWRTGRLQFRRAPFGDVARELERWYDVQITLADSSVAAVPVTARFDDKPLDAVLRALASTLHAPYERRGRDVRFGTTGKSR